jgi:hypothetical protein
VLGQQRVNLRHVAARTSRQEFAALAIVWPLDM